MQALAVYRAAMIAAAIAPTADQAQATAYRLAKVAGETHSISARAWTHWDGLESGYAADYIRDTAHAEAMGELLETASRDLARKHTTITHAAGRVKLINTRERLQGFAADMVKGSAWEIWGGGPKPAELIKPRKARTATWRAGLVKVAAEALQDGQAADFLAIAMDQLGGRAYMPEGKPFIAYAPDCADSLPEGFAVARRCDGEWITMHMDIGRSVGRSSRVKAHALESGREAIAAAGPEKLAAALARYSVSADHHSHALQAWREAHHLAAPETTDTDHHQEAQAMEAEAASDDMAAIVAMGASVAIATAQATAATTSADNLPAWRCRAYVACAAVTLERLTNAQAPCTTRRHQIEAGRRGDTSAAAYIATELQRHADQAGHAVGPTEARKSLATLAAELHQEAQTLRDRAHQETGERQENTISMLAQILRILAAIAPAHKQAADQAPRELATCETAAQVVAMADTAGRGQIQRTGDTFADYWANSASASIARDVAAGRVRVVTLGAAPGAPGAPSTGAGTHTPTGQAIGAHGADTPTTSAAPNYSHPVETRGQGGDYSAPVETLAPAPLTFKQITPDPENASDPAAWFATATASQEAAEYHQDALDHINGQRLHQTRQALAALGWSNDGNPAGWPLTMHGETLRAQCRHIGAGRNVASITWQTTDGETVADDWTRTPQQIAKDLHTSACAFMSADHFASAAQTMTADQCERVALKLEDINYHGEALQWRCLGAGALDLAERVAAINREHLRAGSLTWELSARRQAISDELRERVATPQAQSATPAEAKKLMMHGRDWEGSDLTGWYISEKLDGCRAYWDGAHLYTKEGNPINAPHITSTLPRGFALDGELWAGRGQFETARIFTQYGKHPERVQFIAFDTPGHRGDWPERLAAAADAGAQVVKHWEARNMAELEASARQHLADGAEGLMARLPGRPYRPGRSGVILKIKAHNVGLFRFH